LVNVRIALLVEGATERVFLPVLRNFLAFRLQGNMPRLVPDPFDGRLPKEEQLRRRVESLLDKSADAVIALTDVYTGSDDFSDAADAKAKMRQWVGPEGRFHPHAALHEFEAWLLPYWETVKQVAGSNRAQPGPNPERVNHDKPPSRHLAEVFRTGSRGRSYVKTRDALRILKDADLGVAIAVCAELRGLVDTILRLSGGDPLPAGPLTPPATASPLPGRSRSGRPRRPRA
jgi:hypothetical protein